jgi:hypothetical protein
LKNSNHEDTIFGFRLSEAGFVVSHIDNQLWYSSFDDNLTFIKKTELGLQNIADFYCKTDRQSAFAADVRVLQAWKKINAAGLTGIFALLFRLFRKIMIKNLTGKNSSMLVFDLYKLGYLSFLFNRLKKKYLKILLL